MSADALLCRLENVRASGQGRWRARCPSCGGTNASKLSISESDDGRTLVHCFGGCGIDAIVGAVGLDLSELFPPRPLGDHQPRIRKPWRVRDVVAALKGELVIALVILSDVRAGNPLGDADRQRAGVAFERITLFLNELDHAA
jgi:hypothetical protein